MRLSTVPGRTALIRPSRRRSGRAREARLAGYTPAAMPTPMPSTTPTTTDQGATAAGSGVSAFTTKASASPKPMPSSAPAAERVADSTTNCAQDVPPAGAERLPDADLAGPLAHGHQHDVHDHDAADDQRDGHQAREGEEQDLGDLVPGPQRAFRGLEREIVFLPGLSAATTAHDRLGLAHGALHRRRDRRSGRSARRGC